jgi:hypothetical protein
MAGRRCIAFAVLAAAFLLWQLHAKLLKVCFMWLRVNVNAPEMPWH